MSTWKEIEEASAIAEHDQVMAEMRRKVARLVTTYGEKEARGRMALSFMTMPQPLTAIMLSHILIEAYGKTNART